MYLGGSVGFRGILWIFASHEHSAFIGPTFGVFVVAKTTKVTVMPEQKNHGKEAKTAAAVHRVHAIKSACGFALAALFLAFHSNNNFSACQPVN